jgi:regulator of cell morphogenesis and NO signaling
MPAIDTGASVGRLVAEDISRAEVFERWGIDFCCGGGAPLDSACAKKGIPLSDLVKDLESNDSSDKSDSSSDWASASLTALADHIVATHWPARLRMRTANTIRSF